MAAWRNWSGRVQAGPKVTARAGTAEALQALIRAAVEPIRVAGSGHSFTPVAVTDGTLLRLSDQKLVLDADMEHHRVRVNAGATIHDLGPALHAAGLGLLNQGDIDAQTIAGAISTGTHGTGRSLGALSTQLMSVRLVTGDGAVVEIDESDPETLSVARLSLGLLGVMTDLTLQARPAYALEERIWLIEAERIERDVPKLIAENRHFEFFWFPHSDRLIGKCLNLVYEEPEANGRKDRGWLEHAAMTAGSLLSGTVPALAEPLQQWLSGQLRKSCRIGWSHEIFPSPRLTRFNEMEVAVPLERGLACAAEIADYIRRSEGVFFPMEYRTVADDDVALSPFFERPSATIAIHHHAAFDPTRFFAGAAEIFRRYDGRPHWGKMHWLTGADVAALYPRIDLFRATVRRFDPKGRFRTPYLSGLFGL